MDVLRGDGEQWQSLIRGIKKRGQDRRYRDGACLYRAGESAEGVFLLRKGRILFSQPEGYSIVEPTALLGVSATISGQPNHDTGLADGDCSGEFIPRQELLSLLSQDAAACLYILQKLSEEMNLCYDRLRKVAKPAVRARGGDRRP